MRTRQLLVAISAAQLAVGVAGQLVALRDGRSFDIFRWRGKPERVAHDSWLLGTGLSAPIAMMSVHAVAAVVLAIRPSRRAAGTLGVLGGTMAAGYLVENEFRSALRSGGWEPVVTPVAGVGFALAVAMAVLGLRGAGQR